MTPAEFEAFTRELTERLKADPRVLGLVALGSMARRDYEPDSWSDHDFFVITNPGNQESFRENRSWLPRAGSIALAYRETAHGVKALYDDGHLIEFAVFDPEEIAVARINRYRVLFDRGDLEKRLVGVAARSTASTEGGAGDLWLVGQFLTSLLTGAGRFARGERLAGRAVVESQAARFLLILLARHVPSDRRGLLDGLDPFRRFERVHPELAREIGSLLRLEVPAAARALLDLARRELAGRLPDFPSRGADAVARRISGA